MNHLHHVIESVKERRVLIQECVPYEDEKWIVETFPRIARDAICFDAGDCVGMIQISGITELVRLPFDVCWIEFTAEDSIIGMLCKKVSEFEFYAFPFFKAKNAEWQVQHFMLVNAETEPVQYACPEQSLSWHKACGAIVSRFLSALNCSNVKRIEQAPPAALNKARVRRGKQPLFSTWTLSINIPNERQEGAAMGGTHASPRVHLRRGHARQYKPGMWTWVQACAVGSKEIGMVHKDYKAQASRARSGC